MPDGSVTAWGANYFHQATPPLGLSGMAQISAGDEFTVCLPTMSMSLLNWSVYGGDVAVGKVYLPHPAPVGGTVVHLSSSDPNASVNTTVTVPSGGTSASFNVTTLNPIAPTKAVITATLGAVSQSYLLTVQPSDFSITTNVGTIIGGSYTAESLTINLRYPAPAGGATIAFTNVDPSLSIQLPVVVPAGTKNYYLPIGHNRVHVPTNALFTASYLNTTRTRVIKVNPFQLTSFSVNGSSWVGGNPVWTVYGLNAASRTPIDVQVTSSNPALVPNPGSVTIDPSTASWNAWLPSNAVSTTTPVTLTASLDGSSFSSSLNLISAIGIQSPVKTTVGGSTNVVTWAVNLPSPAPGNGVFVTVTSSDPSASINSPVLVPGGATSANFTIAHTRVTSPKTVTITASYAGSSASAQLTLTPFQVVSFTANSTNSMGGTTVPVRLALNANPLTAITVPIISSDPTTVPTPAAITVPAQTSVASGTFTSKDVAVYTAVTLTAALDGSSVDLPIKIQPALNTLTAASPTVLGATSTTVTLILTQPAPSGGLVVNLAGVNCQFFSPTFTVPYGAQSVNIPVSAYNVSAPDTMKVTVTYGVEKLVTSMSLLPNALTALSVTPSAFTGSSTTPVTLSVSLTAKVAYDTFVTVSSSDQSHVTLPSIIKIPAGSDTGTYTVPHSKVDHAEYVTITASYGGVQKSVQLIVYPG
jgi:hypothetical protein